MYRSARFIGLIISSLLFISVVSAQQATPTPLLPTTPPDEFIAQTDPASLIGSYYNAITLGDYPRAFSYWIQAPNNQTEPQFAAGFSDTLSASALVRLPIFEDAGAGNVYASIPTLVTAERRDGSTVFFAGCFTAHKSNVPVGNATEPDPNWYLQKGVLKQVQTPDFTVLDTACDTEYSLTDDPNLVPSQLDPVQLIESYFSMLITGKVVDAGALWENPGDQFLGAYGKEVEASLSINLYVNPVIYGDGAAGSIYASIPALVVTNSPANTHLYITGCYVVRLSDVPVGDATTPDPNWHFYNATFNLVNDAPSAIALLNQSCTGRG
ncbi:MAG: hypothetical protein ABI690_25150 [Chloroflexota bacterium]